jgi:hypothetical protein
MPGAADLHAVPPDRTILGSTAVDGETAELCRYLRWACANMLSSLGAERASGFVQQMRCGSSRRFAVLSEMRRAGDHGRHWDRFRHQHSYAGLQRMRSEAARGSAILFEMRKICEHAGKEESAIAGRFRSAKRFHSIGRGPAVASFVTPPQPPLDSMDHRGRALTGHFLDGHER